MSELINIYCDESCHLENDRHSAMTLGAVWCPATSARQIADDIRELKTRHRVGRHFESKWTKVSPGGLPFYQGLLEYFFENPDLHFRAVVAGEKPRLRHVHFRQTHDDWYYKMYFQLLRQLVSRSAQYAIYLDIKDTRSADKTETLHKVLCNSLCDFDRQTVLRVQTVGSREVQQVQLADLLTGIVSAANRGVSESPAKRALAQRLSDLSGLDITRSTPRTETKVNIFRWEPQEAQQ